MGLNFTVNESLEQAMFMYMHVIAFVSILLAFPTLYLLYFKTNKNSQRYKMCLINLVFWTTLMDIHFGVLFIPMPYFPLLAGYCIGVLCKIGLHIHYSMVIMCLIVTGVCGGIWICFLFRNQAVLPTHHRLKLSNRNFILTCVTFNLLISLPSLLLITAYGDTLNGEQYLRENHPAMLWVMTRPNWMTYSNQNATSTMNIVIGMWMCLMLSFGPFIFLFVGHTFHVLGTQSTHMSERTKKFHRSLTFNLISQTVLLGSVLAVPLMVIAVSILTTWIPCEADWAAFAVELTHSIVHSSSLILTTSSYKDAILIWLRIKKPKDSKSPITTAATAASVSAMH